MEKKKSRLSFAAAWLAATLLFTTNAFAAPNAGNVSTAIESTWKSAAAQIKTVTNNVIFPIVDCVLVIMLFVKLALLYFDAAGAGGKKPWPEPFRPVLDAPKGTGYQVA